MPIALADQQGRVAVFGKFQRHRFVEMLTLRAHVHHHIQYPPLGAAHQLVVGGLSNLEMHAPDHTGLGAGEKRLSWDEGEPQGSEGIGMEEFGEVAAMVGVMRALQECYTR